MLSFGQGTPTHLQDVIQCLCVLRCDNIRHVMPIWANQVSPLQNWYPIIYIHNDMINSVRYAELGEARLARKKHINTCSGAPWHAVIEPRRMAAVSIVSPMKRWATSCKTLDFNVLPLQGASVLGYRNPRRCLGQDCVALSVRKIGSHCGFAPAARL